MIRFIFIVIAFCMLTGAVVGGLYFWGIDPLAQLGLLLNKPENTILKPSLPSRAYVDFGLLIVPVIQNHEVRSQAEMIIRIEVVPDKKDEVAAALPRLQAGYLEDMLGFLPVSLRDAGIKVGSMTGLDLPAIRQHLQAVSDRICGPGRVKAIEIEHSALK